MNGYLFDTCGRKRPKTDNERLDDPSNNNDLIKDRYMNVRWNTLESNQLNIPETDPKTKTVTLFFQFIRIY